MIDSIAKILIILTLFSGVIYYHELAHAKIFRSYGCEDIKYGLNWNSAFVSANCPANVMRDVNSDNNLNEIIGYNVGIPLFFLASLYLLLRW